MNYNILIVGVGGQGTLLASRVMGSLANILGLDCKLSEVHGMAQRGGSVVTHIKMAEKVFSPILIEGDADIIIAFEKLEALRWKQYLKKDGLLLINDQEIDPMPVIIGDRKYPDDIYEQIDSENIKKIVVNALAIAEEVGNVKTVNTIMLGVFAKYMNISYENIEKALLAVVPAKLQEVNLIALKKGYEI